MLLLLCNTIRHHLKYSLISCFISCILADLPNVLLFLFSFKLSSLFLLSYVIMVRAVSSLTASSSAIFSLISSSSSLSSSAASSSLSFTSCSWSSRALLCSSSLLHKKSIIYTILGEAAFCHNVTVFLLFSFALPQLVIAFVFPPSLSQI